MWTCHDRRVSVESAPSRGDKVSSLRGEPSKHRRAFGSVVILASAVLAVFGLWMLPRQATGDELRAAMAAGRVTGWEFTGGSGAGSFFPDPWDFGSSKALVVDASQAQYLVWQTDDLRRHRTDVGAIQTIPTSASADHGSAVSNWLVETYTAQHPHDVPTSPDGSGPSHWLRLGVLLMTYAGCALWVPRIGTRWFWVWAAAVPLGVGSIAFAVTECLRDPRDRGSRRLPGVVGLVSALVVTVMITLMLG